MLLPDAEWATAVWRRAMKPSPEMLVSEWADRHRVLPQTSSEPGRWRTSRTPYLREIMDTLSAGSAFETIVVMAGSQVGKTEVGLNWLGYVIDHEPGLALLVMPSLDMVKRNVRTRIDPMIEATPALRQAIGPARSKDSSNSIFLKEFPGGQWVMSGANSGAALRSTPARYLFLDEVDAYPGDVDGDGDPVDLAIRRTATFRGQRKILMVSTPKVAETSRIEKAYQESDQRRYFVPCLQCGHMAPITWSRVRWPEGEPHRAHLVCDECGGIAEERDKRAMLADGEWRATAQGNGRAAGFHLPGLYSPFESWGKIAAEHAKVRNDPARLQVWVNTVLAETWQDRAAETIADEGLYGRREPFDGRIPAQAFLLTAGVDVQADRLEVQVIAWGAAEEAWVVAYQVLYGDPTGAAVWRNLDAFLATTYPHCADVPALEIKAVCVDTGGSATRAAYEFVRTRHARRVWGIKGANKPGSPAWPKRPNYSNKGSVPLYTIGVDALKDTIAARLQVTEPGPGMIHFTNILSPAYFTQLTAERRITKYSHGRPVRSWEPIRKGARNEALDTMVYALAALTGLQSQGVDLDAEATRFEEVIASGRQRAEPRSRVHQSAWMQR